jgi:hypothetical protein
LRPSLRDSHASTIFARNVSAAGNERDLVMAKRCVRSSLDIVSVAFGRPVRSDNSQRASRMRSRPQLGKRQRRFCRDAIRPASSDAAGSRRFVIDMNGTTAAKCGTAPKPGSGESELVPQIPK